MSVREVTPPLALFHAAVSALNVRFFMGPLTRTANGRAVNPSDVLSSADMQGILIFFPRDGPIFTKIRPSAASSGETKTLPSSEARGPVTTKESAWIHPPSSREKLKQRRMDELAVRDVEIKDSRCVFSEGPCVQKA